MSGASPSQSLRRPRPLSGGGRRFIFFAATFLLAAAPAPRPPQRLGPPAPANPARLVTLAPSLTETVLALGEGAKLVGVTRFDDAPAVKNLPRVGGYIDPSVEAVLALKPDLVLVEPSPGNKAAVERIARLGAPVLAVALTTEAEILEAIRAVGAAVGVADRGRELAEQTLTRVQAIRARAEKLPKVRTLIVFGWEPLVVGGPGSFAEALLTDAGGSNAAQGAKSAYPVYSAEMAMQSSPELIIDAADVRVPARERILALPGIREARLAVGSPSLFRPGPRLPEAVEELFGLIHPEARP